ncbi:hypothetical protein B0H11DRAFT_2196741 [Mycena galericulata]|nr:hypothetical protein B0H11DRAFT_2196741 [Mycena galericulata]
MSDSEKEEEAKPNDPWPDWLHGTLCCVADCGTTALIFAMKAVFFAIVPLTTLFLALSLPSFGCIPAGNLAALGVLLLVIYQLIFLAVFAVVLDPRRFWAPSLVQYFHKIRLRRNHTALMSPRRYKNYLRTHRYSIFVHGTDETRPVHLRVCRDTPLISIGIYLWRNGLLPSNFISTVRASTRKSFFFCDMSWSDTVGDHGLGTLSSITLSVSLLGGASADAGPSRPARGKAKVFFAALDEGAAEPEPKTRKRKRARQRAARDDDMSDDDEAFESTSEEGEDDDESDDSDVEMVIGGEELAATLTAKTNPKAGKTRSQDTGKTTGKGKAKAAPKKPPAKKKKQGVSSDSPIVVDQSETDTAPADVPQAKKAKSRGKKTNPIWHFFRELKPEDVENAEADKKYYKCNLGSHTVIPLTKTSNGNIVPLKNHLKAHFAQHWRMLLVWAADDSLKPTEEELEIAHGKKEMTTQIAKRFQNSVAKIEGNIVAAMNKRAEDAKEPWNQSHFEELLAKWIAATDQPFSVVEEPEFKTLLNYVHHHSARILALPSADTIRRRIMEMGENVEKKLAEIFAKSEECLIDFAELVSDHSGETMATTVWKPSLLEAVGAITKEEAQKVQSKSRRAPYQEIVTHKDTPEADRNAQAQVDDSESEEEGEREAQGPSTSRDPTQPLRRIVKHVRSSPQRRRSWELTVRVALDQLHEELSEAQLMLILDVRTRWTSTHQMLRAYLPFQIFLVLGKSSQASPGRALHNKDAINRYIRGAPELVDAQLSDSDWDALQQYWTLASATPRSRLYSKRTTACSRT